MKKKLVFFTITYLVHVSLIQYMYIYLFRNPMGRTGIRGKGTLWRWGPNHVIKCVCTRWRRKYNQENQPGDYLYVEGKRVLEFIATQREGNNLETVYELPGVSCSQSRDIIDPLKLFRFDCQFWKILFSDVWNLEICLWEYFHFLYVKPLTAWISHSM